MTHPGSGRHGTVEVLEGHPGKMFVEPILVERASSVGSFNVLLVHLFYLSLESVSKCL